MHLEMLRDPLTPAGDGAVSWEEENKDENENKPEIAQANIFAALAALQTGQLTLSQVKLTL